MNKLNGNANGVAAGDVFTVFELYMDDNGNATRPKNSLASRLLGRQISHGPMILIKLICMKDENGDLKVLRTEAIGQHDIETVAFQEKRADFARKKDAYTHAMTERFKKQGGTVIDLN
jgi:cyclopropane fatty-acyl-phospholipid synthase-like methyltransferase